MGTGVRADDLTRSDSSLVAAARLGDKQAFASLIDRHRPTLIALCLSLSGDRDIAEEVAQESALQALLNLDRLRQPERFGAWLVGIGLNVCRRWLRDRPRESLEDIWGGRPAREPRDLRPGPDEVAAEEELSAHVRRAVAILPDGQRAAVLLFYLSGLTYTETAAALEIGVNTLKTRLHKARRSLRRQLGEIWKEEKMAVSAKAAVVEVRVADVLRKPVRDDATRQHILLLEEVAGDRRLAIWVGEFEGTAIALQLAKVSAPRPLTFSFLASVLEAAGGRLKEVRINRLANETFYASVTVARPRGEREVDARPSDALALALAAGAPIFVDPSVFLAGKAWEEAHPEVLREVPPGAEGQRGAAEIVAEVTSKWPGFRGRSSGAE